jgi:hypothetical protein
VHAAAYRHAAAQRSLVALALSLGAVAAVRGQAAPGSDTTGLLLLFSTGPSMAAFLAAFDARAGVEADVGGGERGVALSDDGAAEVGGGGFLCDYLAVFEVHRVCAVELHTSEHFPGHVLRVTSEIDIAK